MTAYYFSKPPSSKPRDTPRPHYLTCNHYSYTDGKLVQCGAPTKNGKPTCDACQKIEASGAGYQRKNPSWLYTS